jgi:hypothetical protein
MRALVMMPPAKTSHELEFLRAMPDWDVSVVTGRGFGPDDADHHLESRRMAFLTSFPPSFRSHLRWRIHFSG